MVYIIYYSRVGRGLGFEFCCYLLIVEVGDLVNEKVRL